MRELVIEKITEFWLGAESEEQLDLSLGELPNLTDEELLDVFIELVGFAG